MDDFAAYGHALAAVVLYAVIAQVMNAATGIRKGNDNLVPGASHPVDYAHGGYRLDRSYMNTVENLAFFFALVGAAILAGANPLWTNIFASVGLIARIAANVVYLRGIGKGYGGLRTQIIIVHSIANLGLAVITLVAVFT